MRQPKTRTDFRRQERAFSDGIAFVRYFLDEMDHDRAWIHERIDDFADLIEKTRQYSREAAEQRKEVPCER